MSEAAGRLSTCVGKTLAQVRLEAEENHYPVTANDLFKWEHCPLCESKDIARISDVRLNQELVFFATDICNSCSHLFRSISPTAEWFVARWQQISTGELSVYNQALEEKRRVRYELYYGLLHKYKSHGTLLDVGAAYGSGSMVFAQRGFAVEALEPEHDRAEYIKQICKIPVHACTLESFAPQATKYDVILFSHCLEHLNYPREALQQLKQWLKPDGIIYLEIPIAWKVIDWQDSFFMAHKHNFVEKNIRQLVADVGFNVVDSFLIPDNDAPFCNLALLIQPNVKPTVSIERLMDPAHYALSDLTRLYRIDLPVSDYKHDVLQFNVPFINHFYHILKTDRTLCKVDGDFISYI